MDISILGAILALLLIASTIIGIAGCIRNWLEASYVKVEVADERVARNAAYWETRCRRWEELLDEERESREKDLEVSRAEWNVQQVKLVNATAALEASRNLVSKLSGEIRDLLIEACHPEADLTERLAEVARDYISNRAADGILLLAKGITGENYDVTASKLSELHWIDLTHVKGIGKKTSKEINEFARARSVAWGYEVEADPSLAKEATASNA